MKLWRIYAPNHFWGDPLDVRFYLCKKLAEIKNKKILDIGCGVGIILTCLDNTNKVLGIDIDENVLQVAKKLNPLFSFKKLDWHKLKTGQKFDVILLIHSLELIDRGERLAILSKIYDLLRKDGVLILTTPNRQNRYYRKKLNKLTEEEEKELLTSTGFKGIIYGWNPFPIQAGHILKYLPGIFKLLEWLMMKNFRKEKCVAFYIEAIKKQIG